VSSQAIRRLRLKRKVVVHKTPISTEKGWLWWCTSLNPAIAGSINRRTVVQAGLGKKRDPISKITRAKRAGGVWLK
jgi:hypothetical protein